MSTDKLLLQQLPSKAEIRNKIKNVNPASTSTALQKVDRRNVICDFERAMSQSNVERLSRPTAHDLACAVQASVVTLSKLAVLLEMFLIHGPFG